MPEFLTGLSLGALAIVALVVGISSFEGGKIYDYDHAKEECEQHLPRNEKCEIKFIVVQGE